MLNSESMKITKSWDVRRVNGTAKRLLTSRARASISLNVDPGLWNLSAFLSVKSQRRFASAAGVVLFYYRTLVTRRKRWQNSTASITAGSSDLWNIPDDRNIWRSVSLSSIVWVSVSSWVRPERGPPDVCIDHIFYSIVKLSDKQLNEWTSVTNLMVH